MREFIVKTTLFCAGFLGILMFILFSTSPKTDQKMYIQGYKDSLFLNTDSPRIIFIGGSNLSFGINSHLIKDSLGLNPINTAFHAGIGLKYMLRHSIDYLKEGDIIIVSPEYQQFYGNQVNGESVLLPLLFEVSYDFKNLDLGQSIHLLQFSGDYILTKLKFWNYLKSDKSIGNKLNKFYLYNKYGDYYNHWTSPKPTTFEKYDIDGSFNDEAIDLLIEYKNTVDVKKAKLFVTFPCIDDSSFNKGIKEIKFIENILKDYGFNILGTPEDYSFKDSLIYNSSYHLTGEGVNLRTIKLIYDIKSKNAL